jgi:hypothetical protein
MGREIEAIIAREAGYGRLSNGSERSEDELVQEEEFRSDAYSDADSREEMIELENDSIDTLVNDSQDASTEGIDNGGWNHDDYGVELLNRARFLPMDVTRGAPKMKIWYQSTLDFAQHPNYTKALAAHFRKIASSGTLVLLHGRTGDLWNHLPASEIIGSPLFTRVLSILSLSELYWRRRRRTRTLLSLLLSVSPFSRSYVVWQRSQWSQCRRLAS